MGAACSFYGDMSDKYKSVVKKSQGMKPPRKNRLIRQGTEEEIEMF
jgi:hypothetical protein